MTNSELLRIAMEQSAMDAGCSAEDFQRKENITVFSGVNPNARRYLELPFICNLISYGSNIVASVSPEYHDLVDTFIRRYPIAHCFETPNLYVLNDGFAPYGMQVCFMAEYWLPNLNHLTPLSCAYKTRVLEQEDFRELYLPAWSNALCEKRKELDVLGVGAYDGEKLIGLAGCSADCRRMWQIGVDVLPEYRRQGIASALTSQLALETLNRDKVPFYCCAWSNIQSARNAIKSGFRPAWAEMTVKSKEFVDHLNRT